MQWIIDAILFLIIIVQFIYLLIRINKMATSLEQLQLRVTETLAALDTIKTEITAMKEQTITQDQVNTEMDKVDAVVTEIQQVINPA